MKKCGNYHHCSLIFHVGDNKRLKKFKISNTGPIASQLVGTIDGTHVPILSADTESKRDYYCRREMYSINTMDFVDRKLLFSDFVIGFPGSMYDALVLRHSLICNKASDG